MKSRLGKVWEILNKDVTLDDVVQYGKKAIAPVIIAGGLTLGALTLNALTPSYAAAQPDEMTSKQKVELLDKYELQLCGGAIDVTTDSTGKYDGIAWLRHSEKVENMPANGKTKMSQDDEKFQLQFADLLNQFGLSRYSDDVLLPAVTKLLQDYAAFNGKNTNFSNVRIVRGAENMVLDILFDGGYTCVRKNHACYGKETGAPIDALIPLIDPEYINAVGKGKVDSKTTSLTGKCPEGQVVQSIIDNQVICTPKTNDETKCLDGKCEAPDGTDKAPKDTKGTFDVRMGVDYKAANWTSETESPNASGVMKKKSESANNAATGASVFLGYHITNEVELAAFLNYIGNAGTEKGTGTDFGGGVVVGNDVYGKLLLAYLASSENLSRKDGKINVSADMKAGGWKAGYVSPDLVPSKKGELYLSGSYEQLSGDRTTKVDLNMPGVKVKDKSASFTRSNLGLGMEAFYKVGPVDLGVFADWQSTQNKTKDGNWGTDTYMVGPAVKVPFTIGPSDVEALIKAGWIGGKQDAGEGVTNSNMSGFGVGVEVRPAGSPVKYK